VSAGRSRTVGAPASRVTLRALTRVPAGDRPLLAVADGIGVDSTAMLIALWRLDVRPDVILHADVGEEHPLTIAYREERRRWLRSVGFPDLTIVRRPRSRSRVTGLSFATLGEKCIANATLPSLAFGRKGCSVEWKIEPQDRWMRRSPPAQATWARGRKVVKAIGYDAGPLDSRRAHYLTSDDHYDFIYPLRELCWDRDRAVAEIRAAGLPVPRKSACIFCPAMKPWELAEIVAEWPDLADLIIRIEETAQPKLRTIEGLWRTTVKGTRGAIPRPGSMAQFIRALRADPVTLRRYLDMAPAEKPPRLCAGEVVGGVPRFRPVPKTRAGEAVEPLCCFEGAATPRHLPLMPLEGDEAFLGALVLDDEPVFAGELELDA
jgi:hypothetical protein